MSELSDRLRVRMLETLELMANGDEQRAYQTRAPGIAVSNELFNQWDDIYFPNTVEFASAFDANERGALASFAAVVDEVCAATPEHLPSIDQFQRSAEWRRISNGAKNALRTLQASTSDEASVRS